MALVFKLKKGATEVDLKSAVEAGLRNQKWYPKSADLVYDRIPPYLLEGMDILADRDTDDNLAVTMQALDQMARWADMYRRDKRVEQAVYLGAKMDDESYERWSYIRRIGCEWRSDQIATMGPSRASDALLRLSMERHPYWERGYNSYNTGKTAQSTAGLGAFLYDYTAAPGADIIGDVAARISFAAYPYNAGSSLYKLWAGVRSTKYGTPANMAYLWECEDADNTAGTDCSAPQADGTASPGAGNTRREVTFATTATIAKRLTLPLWGHVAANRKDTMGRFLFLLRCKVDSGTECDVRLDFGFESMSDTGFWTGHTLSITDSDWRYYEMYEYQIPPMGVQLEPFGYSIENLCSEFAVQIWAARTSGSGSLYLDCIVLIPVDEGWLIADEIGAAYAAAPPLDTLRFERSPDDRSECWMGGSTDDFVKSKPTYAEANFALPPGDGRIVIAFERDGTSVLADRLSVSTLYSPRWRNLRGADV